MSQNEPRDIFDFSCQLDYSIEDTGERLAKLRSILEVYDLTKNGYYPHPFLVDYFSNYFNPNLTVSMPTSDKIPTCVGLQYMAGYVLFNKDDSADDVVKETTQKDRDTKHVSMQQIIAEQGEERVSQSPPAAKYVQVRPQITDQDREDIPPLADMGKFISALAKEMDESPDPQEKYRLKRILIEARQDQYSIKECYKRPIRFKAADFPTTEYDYDQDTGYFDENGDYQLVSYNTINLSNPEHVHQLLKHYSALRQDHYDNPHNNMRYILDTLDTIIEQTDLKELFRRILIRRIDGETYEHIAEEIHKSHGIKFSIPYLSHSFVKQIPRMIAEQYKQSYQEWHGLNKVKGDYKQCNTCGENKLRTKKFYHVDKENTDGFKNICKVCRKSKKQ